MSKYGVIIHYSNGNSEPEDEIFETEEAAKDHGPCFLQARFGESCISNSALQLSIFIFCKKQRFLYMCLY